MSVIQEIFRRYAGEYLEHHGHAMPAVHRKVIDAINGCRSGLCGSVLYTCPSCRLDLAVPCSCGNRHCPTCQNDKASLWLAKQMDNLLPCPYFMITFTVPQELRGFIRSNQQVGYRAMFDAAAGALKKLAQDERFVGADQIGFFGVLHTWGRTLNYHPHIHFIVPGGGLSGDRTRWLQSRPDFFVHVGPLAVIYRAKFRDAMRKAGLSHEIDPVVWRKRWVVNSQAVGDGTASLKYLTPYVFRVAISNGRIVDFTGGQVTFRYRKSGSNRWRTMSVDAMEFIRRFLQHVLPTGMMKIRHYGFLNANAKLSLQEIREMICVLYEVVKNLVVQMAEPAERSRKMSCRRCGHRLRWMMFSRCFVGPG
jgi:hypothetical protein